MEIGDAVAIAGVILGILSFWFSVRLQRAKVKAEEKAGDLERENRETDRRVRLIDQQFEHFQSLLANAEQAISQAQADRDAARRAGETLQEQMNGVLADTVVKNTASNHDLANVLQGLVTTLGVTQETNGTILACLRDIQRQLGEHDLQAKVINDQTREILRVMREKYGGSDA